jgi:hypothetical protein
MLATDTNGRTYGAKFFTAPSTIRLIESTAYNVIEDINSKIKDAKFKIDNLHIESVTNPQTGVVKITNFKLVDPDLDPVNIENKKRARLARGYSDEKGFRPKISGKGVQPQMKRIPGRPSLGVGGTWVGDVDIDSNPFAEEAALEASSSSGGGVRTMEVIREEDEV